MKLDIILMLSMLTFGDFNIKQITVLAIDQKNNISKMMVVIAVPFTSEVEC